MLSRFRFVVRATFSLCGLFLVLPAVGSAHAEQVTASVQGVEITDTSSSVRSGRRHRIAPVRIRTRVRGIGWVSVMLDQRIKKDWPSFVSSPHGTVLDPASPILLQGTIQAGHKGSFSGDNVQAAAAAIFNGRVKLQFRASTSRGRSRYYSIDLPAKSGNRAARVSSVPKAFAASKTCGTAAVGAEHLTGQSVEPAKSKQVHTLEDYREIEVATDYDQRWFAKFGANSNAEAAARVNAADAIYRRDFGLTFHIVAQNGYSSTSPYTSSDASTLLGQFRTNTDRTQYRTSADAQILFTSYDLDGGTVGIAYVGVLCDAAGAYSYAVIQDYSSALDYLILAHEVGHNLNAPHTTSGIMQAVLSSTSSFAADTISTVASYVAGHGSCLSTTSVTPTPTSTPRPTATSTATPLPTSTATPGGPAPTATPVPSATSTPSIGGPPNPDEPQPDPTIAPTDDPFVSLRKRSTTIVLKRSGRRIVPVYRVNFTGSAFNALTDDGYAGSPVTVLVNGAGAGAITANGAGNFAFRLVVNATVKSTVVARATVMDASGNSVMVDSAPIILKKYRLRSRRR